MADLEVMPRYYRTEWLRKVYSLTARVRQFGRTARCVRAARAPRPSSNAGYCQRMNSSPIITDQASCGRGINRGTGAPAG